MHLPLPEDAANVKLPLPSELWLQIFEDMTSLSTEDLDFKLLRCQNLLFSTITTTIHHFSPSRITLSLPLVCKSWNTFFTPLLYNTVFLSRVSQIEALAALLTKDPQSLYQKDVGSLIKRIVIIMNHPTQMIATSDLAKLMSSCPTITSLHIFMHLPIEATRHIYPNVQATFRAILPAARTLQILNIPNISAVGGREIPHEFFRKMVALRAFRCDSQVIIHKLRPLQFLSLSALPLMHLKDNNHAIDEIFIQEIFLLPPCYPITSSLRRLTLDIASAHSSIAQDHLQDALDTLPPSVTHLSLICGIWSDLRRHIRRLPHTVTSFGLEAYKPNYCDAAAYLQLTHIFRSMDAAGLIFIQFSDPDACMDLRTRHADVLNQLVEILKTRNIDLRDAEGFLIK
ncbi:hypothetical protein ONZ45_g2688 [Pleurotus djamor]|nr:hypothetical protein ONZ45_g2688 [Pleurotus djamor]